tara:strand:- start:4755 stop:5591 length:837 start_codon:yes stop_codon:yes gene_type:complete
MNEFTLSKALNIIYRHFLVTIAIFVVTYWSLPNLNLIQDKFKVQKTVHLGQYPKGHRIELLDYNKIYEIVQSPSMYLYLQKNSESVSKYYVDKSEFGNIFLTLEGQEADIINTGNLIMLKLQEFDERVIEVEKSELKRRLELDRKALETLSKSENSYAITNNDIEDFAELQESFDKLYKPKNILQSSSNIAAVVNLKREDVNRQVNLTLGIQNKKLDIQNLEVMLDEGFKSVSYLFPLSIDEVKKFYPSPILFFGISLFVAFLYNLVLLNYKFREILK